MGDKHDKLLGGFRGQSAPVLDDAQELSDVEAKTNNRSERKSDLFAWRTSPKWSRQGSELRGDRATNKGNA